MVRDVPAGTVTFLFTDIEGSTHRWETAPVAMSAALARHDALLRQAIEAHGGDIFKTVGDAFCAAFRTAPDALAAALAAQRAIANESWTSEGQVDIAPLRVRIALHTGVAEERDGDYFGPPLNRVVRLMSAGHGGQTLLSAAAWELVRDDLPEGVTLRDLGERRLKDLRRPERIYQVLAPGLPMDFPPLATLDARPNNLPVQLTSFVGREREMAQVKERLRTSHLVTLTGVGGTGKTRLSLQVAADLIDDFDHGVWFVDLAPIVEPSLVVVTIAAAVGVRDVVDRNLNDVLAEGLGDKRLLIVLDNCEHVVAACAQAADDILRSAPGVRILATSREALGIAGETTLPVAPLSAPNVSSSALGGSISASALAPFDAVRLFVDRAVAARPDFAVTNANAPAVAVICHQLDGIPLAIELAAARVRMLPPDAIMDLLRDRFRLLTTGSRIAPTRQQTLWAAVDWSHDLLEPSEQVLLRRLAVFRGGWTLAAAETVCAGAGLAPQDVFDVLGRLVDKSLVIADDIAGGARFRWLETVRQYARAKLEAAGELATLAWVHAQLFMESAEALEHRYDDGATDVLNWFAAEHDNLRAVLDRMAATDGTVTLAVRTAIAMKDFWWWRGHLREGHEWSARLLTGAPDIELKDRSMLQFMSAGHRGYDEERASLLIAALEGFLALGDDRHAAWCHNDLGLHAMYRRDFAAARDHFTQRLLLSDRSPAWDRATGLNNLAEVEWYTGRLSEARSGWEAAQAAFERAAAADGTLHVAMADVMRGLGHLAWREGDRPLAWRHFRRGMEIARNGRYAMYQMRMLICLAALSADGGAPDRAARLLGAADACREHGRFWFEPIDQEAFDTASVRCRAALGDAAWQAAFAAGRSMDLEVAVEEALTAAGGAEGMQSDHGPQEAGS